MMTSVIARYKNEVSVKTNQWAQGTFGCFNNIGVCIVAYLLPCVSFGNTADALGKSCSMHALLYWIPVLNCYYLSKQREEIRDIRGIPGSCLSDLLCHVACHPCSLTQESQEVQCIRDDIVTSLAARGQQVMVQGNTITTRPIDTGHGQHYFPGMEPGTLSQPHYQPDTYLHDMTPGPSLPPETEPQPEQNHNDIERY